MAEFAGISEQAMRKWMREPGFPKAGDGSVCLWDLAVWHELRMSPDLTPTDPEMNGVASPALERYRMARAKTVEIELSLKQKEVLDREIVHRRLSEIAGLLRAAGDMLQMQCGEDAFRILNETLDDIENKIEEWFSETPTPAT
jgi:hypothetical protein